MKLDSILILLFFNSILWSSINSVKNNKNQQELRRAEGTLHEKSNDGAESLFAPQIQKYGEMLKPTPTLTKKETNKNKEEEKRLKKREYNKNNYQKNKDKRTEYDRKYREQNKEKRKEVDRKYREKNREKRKETDRKYREKNKEKRKETDRKYREENKERISERRNSANYKQYKKEYDRNHREERKEYNRMRRQKKNNQKEIHGNGILKMKKVQSDNNLGTSINSPNNNSENKGKDPIVCEDYEQINNSERNSLVNSTTDCVNNLSGSILYNVGEGNVQTADANVSKQIEDNNDVFDLSFLDDPDFLNNLNS
uniref:Uncharacterized protein n=1 Tax=Meloidogyne enterolobii TaxID=390850 RepID=A0A6V7XHF8_MELEN|nr:unnamed protein product [Meloidogyne enterolobii]